MASDKNQVSFLAAFLGCLILFRPLHWIAHSLIGTYNSENKPSPHHLPCYHPYFSTLPRPVPLPPFLVSCHVPQHDCPIIFSGFGNFSPLHVFSPSLRFPQATIPIPDKVVERATSFPFQSIVSPFLRSTYPHYQKTPHPHNSVFAWFLPRSQKYCSTIHRSPFISHIFYRLSSTRSRPAGFGRLVGMTRPRHHHHPTRTRQADLYDSRARFIYHRRPTRVQLRRALR